MSISLPFSPTFAPICVPPPSDPPLGPLLASNRQMKTDTPETTWATAPLVLGDRVYNVDSLGNVYAFAVDGGKQAWKTVGGGQPMPLPLFASRDQSVLYVATRGDGWVRAFSTCTHSSIPIR